MTPLVVLCSLHMPKIIELCQGVQMLQAKTSVGTTLVGPPCILLQEAQLLQRDRAMCYVGKLVQCFMSYKGFKQQK